MWTHTKVNSFSNIFSNDVDSQQQGKSNVPKKNQSDIFNLKAGGDLTPNRTGKRLNANKRDNDIFGIRERATGEVINQSDLTYGPTVLPCHGMTYKTNGSLMFRA